MSSYLFISISLTQPLWPIRAIKLLLRARLFPFLFSVQFSIYTYFSRFQSFYKHFDTLIYKKIESKQVTSLWVSDWITDSYETDWFKTTDEASQCMSHSINLFKTLKNKTLCFLETQTGSAVASFGNVSFGRAKIKNVKGCSHQGR